MAGVRGFLLVALFLVLFVCLPGAHTFPVEEETRDLHSPENGQVGGVASESDLCSGYGGEMLKKGGNAADAVSWWFIFEGTAGRRG